MIYLKSPQRTIKFNTKKFKADAKKLLGILNYSDYDLNLWLTTNRTIQKYNKEFRNKDKPTDILSFSYHPKLKPGERVQPQAKEDKNLGDILISLEFVKKDAPRWGMTLEQRMQVLLVHGICHLLGYDHIKDEEYEVMRKKESYLLKKLQG